MAVYRYQDMQEFVISGFKDFSTITEELLKVSTINSSNADQLSALLKPTIQSMCRNFKKASDICEYEVDKSHQSIAEIVRNKSIKETEIRGLELEESKLNQEIIGLENQEQIEQEHLSVLEKEAIKMEEIKRDADINYDSALIQQGVMAAATCCAIVIPHFRKYAGNCLQLLSHGSRNAETKRHALNHTRRLHEEAKSALQSTQLSIKSTKTQRICKKKELERAQNEHERMNAQLVALRRSLQQKVSEQQLLHDSFKKVSLAFSKANHLNNMTEELYSSHQIKQPFLDLTRLFLDSQRREFVYIADSLDIDLIANKIDEINCFASRENMMTLEEFR